MLEGYIEDYGRDEGATQSSHLKLRKDQDLFCPLTVTYGFGKPGKRYFCSKLPW